MDQTAAVASVCSENRAVPVKQALLKVTVELAQQPFLCHPVKTLLPAPHCFTEKLGY